MSDTRAESSPTASAPGASLDRRILSLALPALGALIAEPVFVLIDSAMVGHLGTASLAGLSLASSVLTTVVGLFVFLAYATTATTARLLGAGHRREGLRAGVDGAWLALLIGLLALVLLYLAAPAAVRIMGAHGTVATAAVAYLRASAPGLPGMLLVYAATGTLRGLLDTRTPFLVASLGALTNVAANAALIYGLGLGIAGSGLGTALTQSLMAVALLAPVWRAARAEGVSLRPHRSGLRASLGAGVPLLIRTVSLRAALLATVWAATSLGREPLAAHQVVSSLWTFAAFALDALAIAAQAMVGTALGQVDAAGAAGASAAPGSDDPGTAGRADRTGGAVSTPQAERAGDAAAQARAQLTLVLRRCLVWGAGAGTFIGLVLAGLSPVLPRLFTSDAAVVSTAVPSLLIAATAMPLAGVVYLLDGVLMGAGDGRFLAVAGLATLAVYLPCALATGLSAWAQPGTGLACLWAAFAWVFMGARALTTGWRARTDAWH